MIKVYTQKHTVMIKVHTITHRNDKSTHNNTT